MAVREARRPPAFVCLSVLEARRAPRGWCSALVELVVAEGQERGPDVEGAASRDVVLGDVGRARLAVVDQDEVDRRREPVAGAGADRVAKPVEAGVALEERVAGVG